MGRSGCVKEVRHIWRGEMMGDFKCEQENAKGMPGSLISIVFCVKADRQAEQGGKRLSTSTDF